jgi:hypothetical protein
MMGACKFAGTGAIVAVMLMAGPALAADQTIPARRAVAAEAHAACSSCVKFVPRVSYHREILWAYERNYDPRYLYTAEPVYGVGRVRRYVQKW